MCGGVQYGDSEVKTLYGILLHCIPFPFPQRRSGSRNGTRVAQVQPVPVQSSECPKLEWVYRHSWTPNCKQRCRNCSKSDGCMTVTFHHTLHHSTPHHTIPHYTTLDHINPLHTTLDHITPHTPHHTTLHHTIPHQPSRMYLFSVCIIYSTHSLQKILCTLNYMSILLYIAVSKVQRSPASIRLDLMHV